MFYIFLKFELIHHFVGESLQVSKQFLIKIFVCLTVFYVFLCVIKLFYYYVKVPFENTVYISNQQKTKEQAPTQTPHYTSTLITKKFLKIALKIIDVLFF